ISFLVILIFLCTVGNCYADTIKGAIEKVDLKEYYIIVNGNKVDVSKATIFTENDMNVTKNIIVRDLKDHKGESAACYGSLGKENVFVAYRVRIREGHK
ncbi:MAG: hypothetical protein NT036_03560, partial [Candidatus Omnitrophica bacterium]|nr:hypothetical protein [Candidatus Omnitrophota bacterium]